MKLGLIARMDNSGLGTQTWELYNHLKPVKTMVVDYHLHRDMRQYPERYQEGDVVFVSTIPTPKEIDTFLRDIDVLFMCETSYSWLMLTTARERGIKTIIQPNYEFSGWIKNETLPKPDVFAVPSKWNYDKFPDNKIFLPVPIATERFTPNVSGSAKKFLHIAGIPAANDRNGTTSLIEALQYVTSDITLTITCQRKGHLEDLLRGRKVPSNVRVILDNTSPDNYWTQYQQDVMIIPRRYGGLCLPVNEALGAGMPVVMTDIYPNNEWLPNEWLVPAEKATSFQPGIKGNSIDVFRTDPKLLAAKIDEFADREFYHNAKEKANTLAKEYSWNNLLSFYNQVLERLA